MITQRKGGDILLRGDIAVIMDIDQSDARFYKRNEMVGLVVEILGGKISKDSWFCGETQTCRDQPFYKNLHPSLQGWMTHRSIRIQLLESDEAARRTLVCPTCSQTLQVSGTEKPMTRLLRKLDIERR